MTYKYWLSRLFLQRKEVGSEIDVLVTDFQLLSYSVAVGMDRAYPHFQQSGNLFGRLALFDEGGNLNLCRC